MDYTCFNWVQLIKKNTNLSPNAKYIAMYLATFMNLEQDIAWPSQARISHETGLSKRTVIKKLQELAQEGWLLSRKAAHPVDTGKQNYLHNEYIIQIPVSVQENIRGEIISSQVGAGVKLKSSRGEINDIPGVKQLHPNNNKNNNINNNVENQNFPHWFDNNGWVEYGKRYGLSPRPGEDWSSFKNRVKAEAE